MKSKAKKQFKKGVSLVEVVVAMTIIVLVSSIAIGIVNSYITATDRMLLLDESTAFVKNAKELFVYAENSKEFLDYLNVVTSLDFEQSPSNENMYVFDQGDYSGYIVANYTDSPKTFSCLINTKDGKVLLEVNNFIRLDK